MTLQILRPSLNWLWVQADRPFQVPRDVLEVPGVRYTEPDPGFFLWRCEVPHTAWMLPAFRRWFAAFGAEVPPLPQPVTPPPYEVVARLYPHQREAVAFALGRNGTLVGDEMGLGKTRTALVASALMRQGVLEAEARTGVRTWQQDMRPTVILAPKALRAVWHRELLATGLSDGSDYVALEGLSPDPLVDPIAGKAWVFVHYEVVRAWWSFIARHRPAVAILDEAHLVKDLRTKRGHAAQLTVGGAQHRLVLTGTPLPNRIGEMWSLLELVTGRFTWGSPRDFRVRYAGAMEDQHGLRDGPDVTNLEELQARLAHCYIRRELDEVGLHLPPLRRELVEVYMTPEQAQKYAEVFDLGGFTPRSLLHAIMHGGLSKQTLKWLGKLRAIASEAKLETTVGQVQALLEEGESAVVFTWQKKIAERIARKCSKDAFVIHGDVPQAQRDAMVERFQERGGLICATLGALSVGVTLHKSRIVLMHDLDYVPAPMLQGEARVRRIGQHRPTLSRWIVAKGTIDEIIARIFRVKGDIIMQATGDDGPERLADLIGVIDERVTGDLERVLEWARRNG